MAALWLASTLLSTLTLLAPNQTDIMAARALPTPSGCSLVVDPVDCRWHCTAAAQWNRPSSKAFARLNIICVLQAPYTITVTSPKYNSIFNVYNAVAVGNATNGTATFQVTSTDLNLLPDFSNMVNVTYFIDASSQVSGRMLLAC